MVNQLDLFKVEPKVRKEDLILQMAERMADTCDMKDIIQYFQDNQEIWLESLSDEEFKEQYEHLYDEQLPILEEE